MTAALIDASSCSRAAERRHSAVVKASRATAEAPAVDFEVVRDLAGLAALETDWNALFERAGQSTQVFQTFDWIWQWSQIFLAGDGAGLAIVVARRQGELALVWPLVLEKGSGLTVLTWAGDPVSQYGDVLIEDSADAMSLLSASWSFIAGRLAPDVVHLRKVRSDAAVAPLLDKLGAYRMGGTAAPYLDLASAGSFADYELRYSAKTRKNRRRLMRRLEEQGPVAVETLRSCPEASDRARLAIALKRAWLKERGLVSPAIMHDRVMRFFEAVTRGGDRCPDNAVATLTSNGEAAAVELAFPCKGRLALHVIVYSLKFEKAGAGVLLLESCIERAKAAGYHTIDLLAPADTYKMDWADGAVAVEDRAVALSRRGDVYARFYLGFLRERAKAAIAALPIPFRRFIASGYALALSLV